MNAQELPAVAGPVLSEVLGPLPEPAWFAPQMITEDAYSAAQMRAHAMQERAAERERWRGLLVRALPMLEEHAAYANSAPVWHCTGYEADTLNALIPEIESALRAERSS
jgi:hypothetical protein